MSITHRNALQRGFEFEGYRISGVLGHGGFGITYRARVIETDEQVALKEYLPAGFASRDLEHYSVHPTGPDDEEDFLWGLEKFEQEAHALAAFRHPNIVAVQRFFEANNTAYLVMDYERGDSLAAILARAKTLPEEEIHEFLNPLMDGLSRIHNAGFLHRDIKPENVYIRTDGSPVLLDFGSARLSVGARSESVNSVVTAGYAPLELYLADSKQDRRSDIYSLGAMIYRAVTGDRPPDAPSRVGADIYVPASEAVRGRYSETLLSAVDAALAMDIRDRPARVAHLREIIAGRRPAPEPVHAASDEENTEPNPLPVELLAGAAGPARGSGGFPVRIVAIAASVLLILGAFGVGGFAIWQQSLETERLANERRKLEAQRKSEREASAEKARQAEAQRRAEEARKREAEAEARRKQEEEARRRAEEGRRKTPPGNRAAQVPKAGQAGGATKATGRPGIDISTFQVRNNCRHAVRLVVRIQNPERKWVTVGWMHVGAGQLSRALYTRNRHVYYQAARYNSRTVYARSNRGKPRRIMTWNGRRLSVGHINMGAKHIRWIQPVCRSRSRRR